MLTSSKLQKYKLKEAAFYQLSEAIWCFVKTVVRFIDS